jgi:hypothetical protein
MLKKHTNKLLRNSARGTYVPLRRKNAYAFLLSTPLNGKDVPSFAILVYIRGKRTFLVYKKCREETLFLPLFYAEIVYKITK